jgi:translation initiation factor 2 beta subunit (eIF-2beta)/eIF-5
MDENKIEVYLMCPYCKSPRIKFDVGPERTNIIHCDDCQRGYYAPSSVMETVRGWNELALSHNNG